MTELVRAEQLVRSLLPRFWRLRLREIREQAKWVAHAGRPFTGISQYAPSPEEALRGLAIGLAEHRLPKVFAAAGWRVLGRDVDEVTILTVASPAGERWAVSIGDPEDIGHLRMMSGITEGVEVPMRLAVVPPLATRSISWLLHALGD